MLIVAIPKSASTSLMSTLGRLHSIEAKQLYPRKLPVPENMTLLPKYHSDIREFEPKYGEMLNSKDVLYKQHIPPTENNLDIFKNVKKIVLLREPEDIVLAYRRAELKGLHSAREEFRGLETEEQWIDRARETGLLKDLKLFYSGWKDCENSLIVNYSLLINNASDVINTIERFFSLNISDGPVILDRKRYSKHKTVPGMIHKILKMLKMH